MFHVSARANYDAALCMYHDQALIPIKALHFEDAVNVTLGLPIVRTAPDHGTAFKIAGQDRADPRPMAAAIRMAAASAMSVPDAFDENAEPLREIIARFGLSASKALGQNFILDRQLLAQIAAIPGTLELASVFMKSGPGPGGLTHALLDAGAADYGRRARSPLSFPALEELSSRVWLTASTVVQADALRVDERELVGDGAHVVANLPYNLGTALLLRWLVGRLAAVVAFADAHVSEGSSPADRSRTGNGRLRTPLGGHAVAIEASACDDPQPLSIRAPAKVTSAVVHIVPTEQPQGVDPANDRRG